MTVDVTAKMNAKDRRVWRRRFEKRKGHSIRCAQMRGQSCSCQSKKLMEHGTREKAGAVNG